MITKEQKKEFLEKQKVLDVVKKSLKTEFIGIDEVIDEVIDNVSSWYFMSKIQEKPVVINLWGLTGVGKTSLINRLVQLLNFEDIYYRFDVGDKNSFHSFRYTLEDLHKNNDTSPIIITLDDIQNSRTVEGSDRQEISDDKNRMIWELVDSGKIQYTELRFGLAKLEDMISTLTHLFKSGVVTRNGIIVKNEELYCSEMEIDFEEDEKKLFVPKDIYWRLLNLSNGYLGLYLLEDVEKLLLTLSSEDTINFLNIVLKKGKRPKFKNFTKALIFVIGNLDEAYTMSDNFSADIDANEFNKLSKRITVQHIKRALKSRFRNEQIARLGNIHVIFPALDKKTYEIIIKNELNKFSLNLRINYDIVVEFDETVNKTIYSEGVYPTQGVRPVFTSIHQILKSKISLFLSVMFLNSIRTNKLRFFVKDRFLKCLYLNNDIKVHEKQLEINLALENIRENKKDDNQAITAVHESGHVVLSAVLLKIIPNVVFSTTSDDGNQGLVYADSVLEYISRKQIIPKVAVILGGYVAEEIIFGKENLTAGANNDIKKATIFLSTLYKNSGMGNLPIVYTIPAEKINNTYHNYKDVENDIIKALEEAKQLAETTLKKEKTLLLELSDYLSDNRMLKKEGIRKIVEKRITEKIDFIENGSQLFYRKHLKQQIQKNKHLKPIFHHSNNMLSLNKERK